MRLLREAGIQTRGGRAAERSTGVPFLLAFTALMASVAVSSAEAGGSGLASRTYLLADRPPGNVQAIIQDEAGYLWIGTSSGLVRFDGSQFTQWRVRGRSSLQAADVQALLVARDGTLWVGFCRGGGISRITDSQVTEYTARDGVVCVRALAQDRRGQIWAGARAGLARWRDDGWEYLGTQHGLPRTAVRAILEDRRGMLWVGGPSGLFRRVEETGVFEQVSTVAVSSLSQDRDGSIWVVDSTLAARRIDMSKPARTEFDMSPVVGNTRELLFDRAGRMWQATQEHGLLLTENPTPSENARRRRLSTNDVLALFEDRDGNVWVGSGNGVIRFFEPYFDVVTPPANATGNSTLAVEATPDGTVWLGTADGLYGVAGTVDAGLSSTVLRRQRVNALHSDAVGQLWVGTSHGVGALDGRVAHLQRSLLDPVFVLARDVSGQLWTCSVADARPRTWRGNKLTTPVEMSNGLSQVCTYLFADSKGRIWMAFAGGGLVMYDDGGRHSRYSTGLAGSVCAVHEDDDGALWVAATDGLARVQNGRVTTISRANGLPAVSLTAVLEDQDGYLWLGAMSGLVRLAKTEIGRASQDASYQVRYEHYGPSDGVPAPLVCVGRPSAARRTDGTLWFLIERGVVVVDPRRLPKPRTVPSVQIDRVVVDDQVFNSPRDGLTLPRGTEKLQIDYSAPVFSSVSNLRFQFRLEGFDRDWIEAGTGRRAVYLDLQPGDYRFHLRSTLHAGSPVDTQLGFTVQPFFYETRWFYTACVVAISLVLLSAWQRRVRNLRNQFKVVLDERERIARELHDTILQSMVGATLRIQALAMNADEGTASGLRCLRQDLEGYIEEAHDSIRGLRSSSPEADLVLAALQKSADRIMSEHRVSVEVTARGDVRNVPGEINKALVRIGQEAMLNAARHGSCQRLRAKLIFRHNSLGLCVTDDGRGFDTAEVTKAAEDSWGIRGMQERAASIGGRVKVMSKEGRGTVIEVTVPV